ncbi:response regulator transcription factor [Epilithonimonas hungarica]|uniref:Two component transcriptional regulator, LytTR family n=1 Tax=Epilithonimonas hungarica TaxID=454006 RepID=A0A1G7IHZ9_9FLAO|nr:response regulator transcription factor [Epilithonimonas hungarica]MPT30961.1 DNA-binding response regulator [Chryseobacterium sp.]SDF12166.1 two component transcriptional regulator, LytTR family [Epilithonimonas hungarica]
MTEHRSRILIVEDEVLIAFSVKRTLETYFLPEIANDYEEAKLLLSHKIFDLVLIDISLSGEKTGLDLAQFINDNISIPFIFTTALTDPGTLEKVTNLKPSAYLSKPVESVNLITAINLALANQDNIFKIEIGKQVYYFQSKDFLFAEADHIYVEICLKSGKNQILRTTMSYLEEVFPSKYFKRINRSIAVNPYHITKIVNDKLYIEDRVFKISKHF